MRFFRSIPTFFLLLAGASPVLADGSGVTVFERTQKTEVVVRHQRQVGNLRALARRQGVIEAVPQVFAYVSDFSPVFHLRGVRDGFSGDLDTAVRRFHRVRDMIDLDTLLRNTEGADGRALTRRDLPAAEVYLVVYRASGSCSPCARVERELDTWMTDGPARSVVRIVVEVDLRR